MTKTPRRYRMVMTRHHHYRHCYSRRPEFEGAVGWRRADCRMTMTHRYRHCHSRRPESEGVMGWRRADCRMADHGLGVDYCWTG